MTAQLSQAERVNIGFQFYGVIRQIASSLTEKKSRTEKVHVSTISKSSA